MSDRVNYYVYLHKDPVTDEVVYVGKGTYGRAWDVTRCRNSHAPHQTWMVSLSNEGYLPSDWVVIVAKGLSEKEAFALELEKIRDYYPIKFNRQNGESNHTSKITDAQAKEIFQLSWDGELSRKELAETYNLVGSSISMIKYKTQWKNVLKYETHVNYEKHLREKKEKQ